MKAKIIYNPVSGRAAFRSDMSRAIEILSGGGYRIEVHPTRHSGDGVLAAARACAEEVDLIVAIGGDGTLNEVVNGMAPPSYRPRLGHIPVGTSNNFASTLGIPRSVEKAAKIILEGVPAGLDIGQVGNRYFVYIIAAGAFTRLTYTTPRHLKKLFGPSAYFRTFLKEIPLISRPFSLRVSTESKTFEGKYVIALIISARDFAGMKGVLPDATLNDGAFDILLLPQSSIKVVTGAIRGIAMGVESQYGTMESFI